MMCTRPKQDQLPLISQIMEVVSMSPYLEIDESHENVAGSQAQVIVVSAKNAVLINIEPDKSKNTIKRLFKGLLTRPLLADMYRGGNAFVGFFQTCFVHVWRKSESLAIKYGTKSPEHTYCMMLLKVYDNLKDAAEYIVKMTGPSESACDIGNIIKTVPGLTEFVESAKKDTLNEIDKIIHAYRYGEVSDPETRKFADTLENAAPFLVTFLEHPGMPGSTNGIERTIRKRVVKSRGIQKILPDWQAARTHEVLSTIYATCAKRGVFPGSIVSGLRGCWMLTRGEPLPNRAPIP